MKRSNYLSVGIFVALGVLLFGISIYSLTGDETLFSQKVRVHSYFEDTQGLMFGSVVSFSGITIGNVKSITFAPEKKALKVEYTIKKEYLPLIKEDSRSELKTQGALGDRYVLIGPGSAESPSIKENSEVQSKKGGDIFGLVENKINSIPDLNKLVGKIESLVDSLNSKNGLKGTLEESKKLVENFSERDFHNKSLAKLNRILAKIDSGQGTLGKLINDPSLFNKINNIISGPQSDSDYLRDMARKSIEESEKSGSK